MKKIIVIILIFTILSNMSNTKLQASETIAGGIAINTAIAIVVVVAGSYIVEKLNEQGLTVTIDDVSSLKHAIKTYCTIKLVQGYLKVTLKETKQEIANIDINTSNNNMAKDIILGQTNNVTQQAFFDWYKNNVTSVGNFPNMQYRVKTKVWSNAANKYLINYEFFDSLEETYKAFPQEHRDFLATLNNDYKEWYASMLLKFVHQNNIGKNTTILRNETGILPVINNKSLYDFIDNEQQYYVIFSLYDIGYSQSGSFYAYTYIIVDSNPIHLPATIVGNNYDKIIQFHMSGTRGNVDNSMALIRNFKDYQFEINNIPYTILASNHDVTTYENTFTSTDYQELTYDDIIYYPGVLVPNSDGDIDIVNETPISLPVDLDQEDNLVFSPDALPEPFEIPQEVIDNVPDITIDPSLEILRQIAENTNPQPLPDTNPIMVILQDKLGLFYQLYDFVMSILTYNYDSLKPNFQINLNGIWGITKSFQVINLDFYDDYKDYVHLFISAFAWFYFARRNIKRIPNLLST